MNPKEKRLSQFMKLFNELAADAFTLDREVENGAFYWTDKGALFLKWCDTEWQLFTTQQVQNRTYAGN